VWTNGSVAAQLEGLGGRVHAVGHGDAFTAAGFEVTVHGELHAQIHPDIPQVKNVGFLVGGQVFHPGDALTVPEEPVATLLLPAHAPWSKTGELIDYVRAVHADQAFAVHDGLLNDTGLGLVAGLLGERGPGTPTPYSRLAPGDSVEL
jgi:Beta-lactamase superfamily domain